MAGEIAEDSNKLKKFSIVPNAIMTVPLKPDKMPFNFITIHQR